MGSKRKADAGPDVAQINMQAVEGDGPFAIYFPSGFDPAKVQDNCQVDLEMFKHSTRIDHYAIVAKTVSRIAHYSMIYIRIYIKMHAGLFLNSYLRVSS